MKKALKTRLLLAFWVVWPIVVMCLITDFNLLINELFSSRTMYPGLAGIFLADIGLTLLATTALFILLNTFIRIEIIDGKLCYDPSNYWWRTMKWFYGDAWRDDMPLCKTYWFTFGILLLSVMILVVVIVSLKAANMAIYNISFKLQHDLPVFGPEFKDGVLFVGKGVGIVLGCIAAFIVLVIGLVNFFQWLAKKGGGWYYISMLLSTAAIGAAALFAFIVGPSMMIADKNNIPLQLALSIWSLGFIKYIILIGIPAIAVFALIVISAIKYIPLLRDTFIGQMYYWFKKEACPTVYACPYLAEGVARE